MTKKTLPEQFANDKKLFEYKDLTQREKDLSKLPLPDLDDKSDEALEIIHAHLMNADTDEEREILGHRLFHIVGLC